MTWTFKKKVYGLISCHCIWLKTRTLIFRMMHTACLMYDFIQYCTSYTNTIYCHYILEIWSSNCSKIPQSTYGHGSIKPCIRRQLCHVSFLLHVTNLSIGWTGIKHMDALFRVWGNLSMWQFAKLCNCVSCFLRFRNRYHSFDGCAFEMITYYFKFC